MLGFGVPLAEHMALHIVMMNAVAPALVLGFLMRTPSSGIAVVLSTLLQTGLLWGWHAPAMLVAAMAHPALMAAMHLSLFAASLWFWMTALRARRWYAILALMASAKLFCLLGILMVLAPRALYDATAGGSAAGHHHALPLALPDQQLAGLLMLVACPLSYLAAATYLSLQWVRDAPAGRRFADGSGAR